jgi:hypothetical protein
MSSLSLGPPGFSGCLRGCGSVDACSEGVTEEAGGVGKSELVVGAILSLPYSQDCVFEVSRAERVFRIQYSTCQGGMKPKKPVGE